MSSGIYNQYTGYHNRQSIRLRGYDYLQPGHYFVTVCIHDRKQNLFGDIPVGAGSKPALIFSNDYATIVENTWHDLPNHINQIELDEFIIMPNHFHGVIRICDCSLRAGLEPAPTKGIPEIIRQFKTFSAKRINIARQSLGKPVWQRNYYEHIIRNEKIVIFYSEIYT
jgi:putative transposase